MFITRSKLSKIFLFLFIIFLVKWLYISYFNGQTKLEYFSLKNTKFLKKTYDNLSDNVGNKRRSFMLNMKFYLFRASASKIYCTGDILHRIQMSGLFLDSKGFVDMPTKHDLETVQANYDKLGNDPSEKDIERFLDENFHSIGHDVVIVEPSDWTEQPDFLTNVHDERLLEFGKYLNSKWKKLLRKQDKSRICARCISSVIETRNPFVVPGGRFIEYYYWDTFWIVSGLLSSNMIHTARGIIKNFLDIVETNGFVPNGARVYYLNRSQPPLLTQMVDLYVKKTNDYEFLAQSIHLLDMEYNFWMTQRIVDYQAKDGRSYRLNAYNGKSKLPRPESYKEDLRNARASGNEENYYSNIISAAESGWDFSSRWFNDPMDIKTIVINEILPVDLNAIMLKNEKMLFEFHTQMNSPLKIVDKYKRAIEDREQAMNTLLWDDELKTWADFNYKQDKLNLKHLYISNLTPLWADIKLKNDDTDIKTILARYESLLMKHKSGIPASDIYSGQQWDFPNVWAPYHSWMVDFFRGYGRDDIAFDIAQRFVNTVFIGWARSKRTMIFEKYDADELGAYGKGGEYIVQEGFGWTNGVVIKFMEMYGNKLKILGD